MIPGRGDYSASGLDFIQVDRACKIGARWCTPGDIVKVERVSNRIMPIDDRLDEKHAQHLVRHGYAHAYQPRHGEKSVSVEGAERKPLPTAGEWLQMESETDPKPKAAERAISQRGQSGKL